MHESFDLKNAIGGPGEHEHDEDEDSSENSEDY